MHTHFLFKMYRAINNYIFGTGWSNGFIAYFQFETAWANVGSIPKSGNRLPYPILPGEEDP